MVNKIGKVLLVLILTAAVLTGAYRTVIRHQMEQKDRTVELVADLNGLKKIADFEKIPLGKILDEVKQIGITSLGIFEETLPDAGARGELSYASGSGILRLPTIVGFPTIVGLEKADPAFNYMVIHPDRTYLYVPDQTVKRRIFRQIKLAVGKESIKYLNRQVIEVDAPEEELRPLGIGLSESQSKYLVQKGFRLVPRLWNDPHYGITNIEAKISTFQGYDLIIFDGEDILGYPEGIAALSGALKKFNLRYGHIEIVKQDGDAKLKKLMGIGSVKVHSVPKDELKKISKEEALERFVRAARERSVRVIYLRPFFPPQTETYPVEYNLQYFKEVKDKLVEAGFVLGPVQKKAEWKISNWELGLLGAGIIIGGIFLLEAFLPLPLGFPTIVGLMYLLLFLGLGGIVLLLEKGYLVILQKLLAFMAAVIFPSYAVIGTLSKKGPNIERIFWKIALLVINIVAKTFIGIFLMVGVLSDSTFMGGGEAFPAVKLALVLPILLIAFYFILKHLEGDLRSFLKRLLDTKVNLSVMFGGLLALMALLVLVARSGNFVLPVPQFEKYFRNWLEMVLFVRPRTKEFLVGYPFLFLAGYFYLKGNKSWLWLLAAVGVVAPVSFFNSFSHLHTPVLISLVRTFNGLVLGLLLGWMAAILADKYFKTEK